MQKQPRPVRGFLFPAVKKMRYLRTALLALLVVPASHAGLVTQSGPRLFVDGGSPPAGEALFTDGFEDGNVSHTENNIRWTEALNVSAQTTQPNSGSYSARFRFGPDDVGTGGESSAEFNGLIGTTNASGFTEVWLTYALYVPANYEHDEAARPNQTHGYNNKGFFYLWDGGKEGYGSPEVGMGPNLWPNSNFDASYNAISEFSFYVFCNCSRADYHYWRDIHPTQVLQPAITTADLGAWMDICVRYKYATSANNDGIAQIWKKPGQTGSWVQLLNIQNGDWYSAAQPGFDAFYLLGYANSGFTEQTDLYMDDVRFGTSDICGVNE